MGTWLMLAEYVSLCGRTCQKSKTLVKLTLGSHIDLGNIPPGVSLPALKSLFINTIFFTYGDLCNVLLPGCPVLEELSICPACHLILTPASADVISPCVKRGLSLPVFKNLVALPYFPSFMFQALLKKMLA
uniref:Uncharacterized protein n=1 Tax=Brassica oleracea var. oleracea TaxID=109376 RepID=A0A0D3BJK2_BRAOL